MRTISGTMCGIAGVVGDPDSGSACAKARRMAHCLAARGPDAEGIEAWPTAILAHRRLSVFDLSDAGSQPMLSSDRSVGVVFNGAIYNFRELRRELEGRGFVFKSTSDTEVLVHAYRAFGIDTLVAKLHGMFAFAVWDERLRTLYLVRDRLGVKPLLYVPGNSTIAFASSARALCEAGLAGTLDTEAIAEFFEFGFITDDRSIYREVRKVQAAQIVEWSEACGLSERTYWTPPQAQEHYPLSFEDVVEETERLLLRAVEMRLQADVPVGALLSGGIDSSLVCWAIRKLGADITAFTVGTPDDVWDETADATATASELKIRHRILPLQLDPRSSLAELVSAYGEPFACASALGMLAVSRAVKEQATVLLTGDGGDDVFLGYDVHQRLRIASSIAGTLPKGSDAAWKVFRRYLPAGGVLGRARHLLDYATGGVGAVAAAHDGLPAYAQFGFAGERLRSAEISHRTIPWDGAAARNVFSDFLKFHQRTRFVSEYLTKVDGSTMRYGLEARSPFLDQDVWVFASALPVGLRMRGGKAKAVLRELARRRIGPRVANGTKRGFGVPVQRWITGPWRADLEQTVRDSLLEKAGWIRPDAVLRKLSELSPGTTAPVQMWYLYVLESWLRAQSSPASEACTVTVDRSDRMMRAGTPPTSA